MQHKTSHNQNNMKKNIITWLMLLSCITISAQGIMPLPTLHVEGRWLVDKHGNQVVLHGVMDTPNMYFNDWRWGKPWTDGTNYNDAGASKCLLYFEKLFVGMEQAKCNVFRLHMDPAWTNDESITATGFSKTIKNDKTIIIDPNGQEVDGEADISHFSETRYRHWLTTLYLELAKKAMNHGMFVVVRPPGVCPHDLKVGDYYNQYLMSIWDIFSQNEFVKEHAGQISIELANEPVSIKDASNKDNAKAPHDFFQPIVDKIRANGFTGIIWVPGTSWQGNYTCYATNPITDDLKNIGYAVHDYDGWYGCEDKKLTAEDVPGATQRKIESFHSLVPVVDSYPVIVTEIDWSPVKEGSGHYNEHGVWVESNYGTWATGRTSVWGSITKGVYDHFQNISMTLSGTGCLLDIDKLLLTPPQVVPAFNGLAEACGKACMDWYAEYYNVNWPHADDEAETGDAYTILNISAATNDIVIEEGGNMLVSIKALYADGHTQEVCDQATYTFNDPTIASANNGYIKGQKPGFTKVTVSYTKNGQQYQATFNVTVTAREFFSFKQDDVVSIHDNCTYNESTRAFTMAAYGQIGWKYPEGIDISGYKYLVVKLKQAQNIGAEIRIFPVNTIWNANEHIKALSGTMTVVKLSEVNIDLSKVYIIDFWSRGGTIYVEDVYLTNNDDYSKQTTGINTIQRELENDTVYNLQGVKVGSRSEMKSLPRGIYIIGGKKVVVR